MKTDLAKFENTWDQLPHIVSRGAQKNFSDYMIRRSDRQPVDIDRAYFERIVARAILFRTAERVVQRQNFGGYRANIVTYTLALLSNAVSQRIDLTQIWRDQALTENLQLTIAELAHEIHRIITNPPSARNITEWCKSEPVLAERAVLCLTRAGGPDSQRAPWMPNPRGARQKRSVSELPSDYVDNLTRLVSVNPPAWKLLAEWGAETAALEPGQRQLAIRIGRAIRERERYQSFRCRRGSWHPRSRPLPSATRWKPTQRSHDSPSEFRSETRATPVEGLPTEGARA